MFPKLRLLLLLLLFAAAAFAQPALVTIADTVYNLDGTKFAGKITITGFTLANGGATVRSRLIILCSTPVTFPGCSGTITNGALSVQLVPTTTSTPANTWYTVQYQYTSGPQSAAIAPDTWIVPAGGPYTIAEVWSASPPVPTAMVSPVQLNGSGYSNGQTPTWNSTTQAFAPNSASGSGNVNYGVNTVACVSSPTFNMNSASYSIQYVSLTCSIGSMSFTNLIAGALVTFRFCRTGSDQTFSGWPGTVHGGMLNAAPLASTCDSQSFYSPDGTNLYSNGPGALNQP